MAKIRSNTPLDIKINGTTVLTADSTGIYVSGSITANSITTTTSSIDTGSFVTTSSFNSFTGSYNTGSFTGSLTGTLIGTASWATRAITASVVTATGNQGAIAFKGSTFLTSSNNLYYNGANLILNNGKIWQSDSNVWYTVLGSTGQASANENGLFSYDSNLDFVYPVVSYDQAANKYYFANYQIVHNGTNGNTGIGTAVPSAKLEVNGNVKATSFTGDGSGLTNVSSTTPRGQIISIAQANYTII